MPNRKLKPFSHRNPHPDHQVPSKAAKQISLSGCSRTDLTTHLIQAHSQLKHTPTKFEKTLIPCSKLTMPIAEMHVVIMNRHCIGDDRKSPDEQQHGHMDTRSDGFPINEATLPVAKMEHQDIKEIADE